MGTYIKKNLLARPVAPQLSLLDQLTDLLIDMSANENGKGPTPPQLRSLSYFSSTLHRRVELGLATTERRASRIWDTPAPPPARYGRDDYWTLPERPTLRVRRAGSTIQRPAYNS